MIHDFGKAIISVCPQDQRDYLLQGMKIRAMMFCTSNVYWVGGKINLRLLYEGGVVVVSQCLY